jgi:aryl-alcohol dehydrogenase-like predicted oxidoreductase
VNYSLIACDIEHEIVPLGLDQSVGIMAWSPLHAGFCSAASSAAIAGRPSAVSTSRRSGHRRLRARVPASSMSCSRSRESARSRQQQVAQLGVEQAWRRHGDLCRTRRGAAAENRRPPRGA